MMKEMQMGGMAGGALFLIGIAAIFTSGGNVTNMVVGDVMVAAAGVAMVFFGGKQSA
jgi:NADH:ubiquinone oxidoreductase subunit K